MWLCFLTGLAMNLGGFYWLTNMLKTFSGFPIYLCLLFVVIICSYQALRLAFMGWLYGRASQRGWPLPVVFAGSFAVSELVFPLLFPWYYAATVHNVPVLMQTAELGGPILVGLVLVAVNMAIAEPLRARLAARRELVPNAPSPYRGSTNSEERVHVPLDRRVIGVGVIALLGATLFGAARISMVKSDVAKAEPVRVGYVQGNMGLMEKREQPGEGLRRHSQLTQELRDKGVDFVVWSESSVTFSVPEEMGMKTPFYRDRFAGTPRRADHLRRRALPRRSRIASAGSTPRSRPTRRARSRAATTSSISSRSASTSRSATIFPSSTSGRRTAAASRRARRSSPSTVDVKGAKHKVSRPHLLRGHPPVASRTRWSRTPTPSSS